MNKSSIEILFRNYIENFGYFDAPEGGYETYKWKAVGQAQKVWDLAAADLSGMIKQAFSQTYNLINNSAVSPGNGLALAAKEEPETVRKALAELLEETEDADEKQKRINSFVTEINALLAKYYPGKWRYEQDDRVAITYLALIVPSQNYLYKSTPAHYFADWMGFDTDIGNGESFKLKHYYQMCDELLAEVNACPELLAKDAERNCEWKDRSNHLLVTDLIYCFCYYPFMREGLNAPEPRRRANSAKERQAEMMRKAAELQERMDRLQDEVDALEKQISELPAVDFTGKTVRTKLYGDVVIKKQEGNYLSFTAEGKERQYAMPTCITNGFVILADPGLEERYRKEADILEKLQKLNSEQRLVNIQLRKY